MNLIESNPNNIWGAGGGEKSVYLYKLTSCYQKVETQNICRWEYHLSSQKNLSQFPEMVSFVSHLYL